MLLRIRLDFWAQGSGPQTLALLNCLEGVKTQIAEPCLRAADLGGLGWGPQNVNFFFEKNTVPCAVQEVLVVGKEYLSKL